MHFLSKLERDFYFNVQWDPGVLDIREQFLLDLRTTQTISDEMRLKHPTSPRTGLPFPMSTDFLITKQAEGKVFEIARSVKPFSDIEFNNSCHPKRVKRNWEKFLIEREYWKRLNVELRWVTERDFSLVLARNVQFVHSFYHLVSLTPLTSIDVTRIEAELLPMVSQESESLAVLCAACDRKFRMPPGISLRVVKHLIAKRRWKVDFNVAFDPSHPMTLCN
jgi:hypothetical protein